MSRKELVYVVDGLDKVIATMPREEANRKKLRTRATIILVFNSKDEILVTKRSKSKRANPNLWEIGQGGVVNAHETYTENASRELEEEVGLKRSESDLKYLFDYQFSSNVMNYNSKVFSCRFNQDKEDIILQKDEIQEGKFLSYLKLTQEVKKTPEKFTSDSTDFLKVYDKYMKEKIKRVT